jgi:signal transduction histidine kinase
VRVLPRQRVYLVIASLVFLLHLVVAAATHPSLLLTMYGDASPCVLLLLAILTARENFRRARGLLPLFWKVFAGGLGLMMFSESFWFYYDWVRQYSAPSPMLGDSLFVLAHVFFLSALALRPHSASAGRDLRTRSLDFVLLSLWWFTMYAYFCLPWQAVLHEFAHYNPTYYTLVLILHLVIILALGVLAVRKTTAWRGFYLQLMLAFLLIAGGNLLIGVAINRGWYYAGSYYDTPFLLALYMFTLLAGRGPSLRPQEDGTPNRELAQSVWTARFAMLGILSLPLIAIAGLFEKNIPDNVETFRLRMGFGAMFVLGVLVYWKMSLLTRELVRLVRLTHDSIEKLKSVEQQVTHSEKLVALGRLASGAAHEISNPLTAILGYSELLADIPSLTQEDRENSVLIQQQVHRAQAAVSSLRNSPRSDGAPSPPLFDKKPVS